MSDVISLDEWRKKQKILSDCKSASKPHIPFQEIGLGHIEGSGLPIEDHIAYLLGFYITLDRCWRNPPTLKSTFSRLSAFPVAVMASLGYISNCIDMETETYAFNWHITENGMKFKGDLDEMLKQIIKDENNSLN